MSKRKIIRTVAVAAVTVLGLSAAAQAAPFGSRDDVNYAAALWQSLVANRLAGPDSIYSTPYEGTEPHGFVLETIDTTIGVKGHTGLVIVKRNYGPEGVEKDDVADNPGKYLAAVTVMFRREKGYDPDNGDWFWVKYAPNGTILTNPAGMKLAGMVGKGSDKGCIACHKGADGEDMIFNNNRYAGK